MLPHQDILLAGVFWKWLEFRDGDKNEHKKLAKRDAWNNRNLIFVLHRYGSFGCYADVIEDGSSITASPGLGILIITSFTVPET